MKVQHEGLRETAAADVITIEYLVRALHWALPDFDYTWLVDTTKENLPQVHSIPCSPLKHLYKTLSALLAGAARSGYTPGWWKSPNGNAAHICTVATPMC